MAALVLCVGGPYDGKMAEVRGSSPRLVAPDPESMSMVEYHAVVLTKASGGYSVYAAEGLTEGDVLARLIGHYQPHSVAIAP